MLHVRSGLPVTAFGPEISKFTRRDPLSGAKGCPVQLSGVPVRRVAVNVNVVPTAPAEDSGSTSIQLFAGWFASAEGTMPITNNPTTQRRDTRSFIATALTRPLPGPMTTTVER